MLVFKYTLSIVISLLGNHFKIPYFTYTIFFPYTPSNQFFELTPFVFLEAQLLSIFFLHHNLNRAMKFFPPGMRAETINSTFDTVV